MAQVTIYTKDYCGFCAQAKALLRAKDMAFNEIDVTYDPALQAEMIERSGPETCSCSHVVAARHGTLRTMAVE